MAFPSHDYLLEDFVFGVEEQSLEILEQSVFVLLNEAIDVVDDVTGVVLDQEIPMELQMLVLTRVHISAGVVLVALQSIIGTKINQSFYYTVR